MNLTFFLLSFLSAQTMLTAISMSAIATNGVVPGRMLRDFNKIFTHLRQSQCCGASAGHPAACSSAAPQAGNVQFVWIFAVDLNSVS